MVVRRISVKRFELVQVLHGSKFGNVECSVRMQFHAEHVENTNARHCRLKQVRMLGDGRADQESAVASSLDCQPRRIRIFGIDQIPRARGKVVKHLLFVGEVASAMPGFAVFAATAEISDRENPALFDPQPPARREGRREVDAIASVPVKQRRILAGKFRPLFADNVDRHANVITRNRVLAPNFRVAVVSG